jgi:hypothetical protein
MTTKRNSKKTGKAAATKKTPVRKASKKAAPVKAAPKRATAPTDLSQRLPEPGSTFTRAYKGRDLTIKVLEGGAFEYEGTRYSSLSSLARAITNYSVSGPLFFRVVERKPAKATGK